MDQDQTARMSMAGLDPDWSQMHYVGFGVTRLIYISKTDKTLGRKIAVVFK
jgi:hypothetical protein